MSFILDALKKSENERQRTVGPALTDAPFRRARPERPWWAVAVAALLIVNLAVLIVVLMRDSPAAKVGEAVNPNVAPQAAPVAIAPAPAPAPAPESFSQPAVIPAEPVLPSASYNRSPGNPAVRSLAEEAGISPDPRISAALAAAAAVPSGPPLVRSIQPPSVTPLPAGAGATFNSVAAASNPAASNVEVLPSAGDLTASGNRLPDLKLDIHVFATNPAERFVFVNMRKYLEGQTLQEGPTVEKITNDGVVLNSNGLRYVLPRQ